jgi:choline-sulfatase
MPSLIQRSSTQTAAGACALLAGLFAFGVGGCQKKEQASPKPNVLIITVDTLRADRLGVYGDKDGLTPNLDALAKEGVTFEHAISQVPLTWPSHAAIFTGTYPFHNGVQDFTGQPLSSRFRTLAESFKANGYATGAVVSSFVLDRSWGLARGFDSYDDAFSGQQFVEKDLGLVERRADASVDHAIGWLSSHATQPFFFWLHLYDPHSPYDPPEPFATKFKSQPYDGEVAYTDSQLARLFDWLKQAPHNVYDNTVIVFLSDHGESLGEHGEKEHGFFVYDSTVRVPLIVKPARAESILPDRTVTPAVEAIQIGPTVLEMAGIHDAIEKQFQAHSLVPFLTGQRTNGERSAFSETTYPQNSFGWSALRSVQTDRLQYIEAPRQELYDLQADAQEKNNIAEKDAATASRMRNELNNRLTLYAPPSEIEGANSGGASPEVIEKLRSLGYVAYKAPTAANAKLADPKDKLLIYQDVLRATDLMQLGKFAAADAILSRLQHQEPDLYLIPFLQGEAAERMRQWKNAEKSFGRTLQLNPGFKDASMGLARALGYEGKTEQAVGLLQSMLSANPKDFRTWFLLAQIEAKNNPQGSRDAFNKVLEIQPNFAPAYRERGMLNVQAQNYQGGADDLSQAVSMGLTDAGTYNFLGICYSRLGRLNEAVESYQKALAVDPKLAQAHLNLGFAYERMGDNARAASEYKEACRLDRQICAMVAGRLR